MKHPRSRHLGETKMKFDDSKALILLASVILGFLLGSQQNLVRVRPKAIVTLQEYQRATASIRKLTDEIYSLTEQKRTLEQKISEYKSSDMNTDNAVDKLGEELNRYEFLAGMTSVKGPGVLVTVSDSLRADNNIETREVPTDWLVVHDADIRDLVWELKNAGADAISVNGQRVISSTEFSCAGPVIYINNKRCFPPFEIRAIGDQDNLDYALENSDLFNSFINERELQASYIKDNEVVIPGYKGSTVRNNTSLAENK